MATLHQELSDISNLSERLKQLFEKSFIQKEKQEHLQGSVPGTAFQGKETPSEERAEVLEVGNEAVNKIADLKKVAEVLLKSAAEQVGADHTDPGKPNFPKGIGLAALAGGAMYGKSLLTRSQGLARRPTMSRSGRGEVGIAKAMTTTAVRDVAMTTGKIKALGKNLMSKLKV